MKKLIVALILALMSLTAFGQRTLSEMKDNFKNGHFYMFVDGESFIYFSVDFNDEKMVDEFGKIDYAKFTTKVSTDASKRGNDWFISKLSNEDDFYTLFETLYNKYGILIYDDYVINEDGSFTVTLALK